MPLDSIAVNVYHNRTISFGLDTSRNVICEVYVTQDVPLTREQNHFFSVEVANFFEKEFGIAPNKYEVKYFGINKTNTAPSCRVVS